MFLAWQEREADLAMFLVHPNIVRCLGKLPASADGNRTASKTSMLGAEEKSEKIAFLIFEHIPGTLLELIQASPGGLPLEQVQQSYCRCLFYKDLKDTERRVRADSRGLALARVTTSRSKSFFP